MPLPFEGVTLRNPKIQLAYPNDHLGILSILSNLPGHRAGRVEEVWGGWLRQPGLNLLHFVGLDNIPHFDIVEILDANTTFKPLGTVSHVVLEPL